MGVTRSGDNGLFLGVDGGQTSTVALIGNSSGQVLATGVGGPSNHVKAPLGRERLKGAVSEAVGNACVQLGCEPETIRFETACCGFTGGISDKEEILREVIRCRRMLVTDDIAIALAGAHDGGPGTVTIAGTGSVSMARNSAGTVARAGGWGYMFGDEGGAWGIVREALRAALRYKEGWGLPTALHDMFLECSGDSDIHVFRRRLYTQEYPRPRIAALSQLVAQAAAVGDGVALEILNKAADDLAVLTKVVREQVFASGDCIDAAYVGGVFSNEIVLEEFRRKVEFDGHVRVIAPRHDPAMGALLEAVRLGQST